MLGAKPEDSPLSGLCGALCSGGGVSAVGVLLFQRGRDLRPMLMNNGMQNGLYLCQLFSQVFQIGLNLGHLLSQSKDVTHHVV